MIGIKEEKAGSMKVKNQKIFLAMRMTKDRKHPKRKNENIHPRMS